MGEGIVVVVVVAIACTTSLGFAVINTIKAAFAGRGKKANDVLLTEIRELRAEVRQLRQQNNDIMLAVDNTLDRRVAHVDARMRSAPRPAEAEQQVIHRG
jgi:hypothetical protein